MLEEPAQIVRQMFGGFVAPGGVLLQGAENDVIEVAPQTPGERALGDGLTGRGDGVQADGAFESERAALFDAVRPDGP